ncbi:hypothetical protein OL229_05195 [Neisseriaceae bacterium JH1-16]|nr:hypothetical protein [Neisseriaceae bacterium JH1-16]
MEKTQIEVRAAGVTPAVLALIGPAFAHDDTLGGDVGAALAGCDLYTVHQGEHAVCAFALRSEQAPAGREVVVVGAGGKAAGFSLTEIVLPHIEETSGAEFVRIHTARPGMVKRLRAQGYEAVEVVMRKRVNHGR